MGFIKPTPPPSGQRPDESVPNAPSLAAPLPADRRAAVYAMADIPGSITVMAQMLRTETELSVREALMHVLANDATPVAVDALTQCLRSEDAALRNQALDFLKGMPSAVEPFMDTLLNDPDSDVRILAVNMLDALPNKAAQDWLIDLLERERHINVCTAVVDVLAEIGTEDALPALLGLKDRFPREPFLKFAVDLTVRRIRGEGGSW